MYGLHVEWRSYGGENWEHRNAKNRMSYISWDRNTCLLVCLFVCFFRFLFFFSLFAFFSCYLVLSIIWHHRLYFPSSRLIAKLWYKPYDGWMQDFGGWESLIFIDQPIRSRKFVTQLLRLVLWNEFFIAILFVHQCIIVDNEKQCQIPILNLISLYSLTLDQLENRRRQKYSYYKYREWSFLEDRWTKQ